jgi:ABC-2 type transport system permease protein
MLHALRSELYRMSRRWMPRILLGSVAVFGAVFYELIYVSINAQLQLLRSGNAPANTLGPGGVEASIRQLEDTLHQLQPSGISELGIGLVAGLGAVMLIIFAASHMGTEFGWGTLRTLLASGLSRTEFLTAKLVTVMLFAVVFTIVGVVAAIVGSFVVSTQAGFDTSGLDLGKILSASWRTGYSFLPYLALASLIGLWSRSSGAGIAAGLVIYFAESIVMSLLISFNRDYATIANLGIARNVQSLSRVTISVAGSNSSASASTLPDQTQAAIVLAVWTVLFIALAFWRLRARDITLS